MSCDKYKQLKGFTFLLKCTFKIVFELKKEIVNPEGQKVKVKT